MVSRLLLTDCGVNLSPKKIEYLGESRPQIDTIEGIDRNDNEEKETGCQNDGKTGQKSDK